MSNSNNNEMGQEIPSCQICCERLATRTVKLSVDFHERSLSGDSCDSEIITDLTGSINMCEDCGIGDLIGTVGDDDVLRIPEDEGESSTLNLFDHLSIMQDCITVSSIIKGKLSQPREK